MTAVVAQHNDLLPIGWTGVWLFFVISGYVVTLAMVGRQSSRLAGVTLLCTDDGLGLAAATADSLVPLEIGGGAECACDLRNLSRSYIHRIHDAAIADSHWLPSSDP